MVIHQAVFGPLKGHAFLKGSSASLEDVFRNVAWATDLPQTAPPGVSWTNYFRLVRVDSHLLLIYTQPREGTSRSGMVLSRVAFIPLSMLEQLDDIRPIAQVLKTTWVEEDAVLPINLIELPSVSPLSEPTELVVQIAQGLSRAHSRPLVVLGQEGFDDAMLDLWGRVPAEFRGQLTFGLSFGPEDVRDLSVVCTPDALSGRWASEQQINKNKEAVLCSHTATLLNVPNAGSARPFANDLRFKLNSPTSITLALEAFHLWDHSSNPSDLVRLLRILAERTDSEYNSTAAKSTVVERLIASSEDWTAQDVLALRNIEPASIPKMEKLSATLTVWVGNQLADASPADIRDIIQSWAAERATSVWLLAVEEGLKSVFASDVNVDALFAELWNVLLQLPAKTARILSLTTQPANIQGRFAKFVPRSIEKSISKSLALEFGSRGWWQTAGIVLARSHSAMDSLRAALELDSGGLNKVLLLNALSEATDQEVVAAAVATQHNMAIQVAADAAARTPHVMEKFEWRNPVWFRILEGAVVKSEAVVGALPNVSEGIGQLIDAQLADETVWRVIATTRLANLMDVPGRERAWSLMPTLYVSLIAKATARGWLQRFEEGKAGLTQIEPSLTAAIRAEVSAPEFFIQVLKQTPSKLILYLQEFGFVSEYAAKLFMMELQKSGYILNDSVARTVGRIIRENRWEQAAKDAARLLRGRFDCRPIMEECISILGLIDRLWVSYQLGISAPFSQDDAWSAFESEAIALYPWGPSQNELWSRSDGSNEDLFYEENGRATWHRCIRELRSGKAPGAKALLKVMLKDYPHNDTLKQLFELKFWRSS